MNATALTQMSFAHTQIKQIYTDFFKYIFLSVVICSICVICVLIPTNVYADEADDIINNQLSQYESALSELGIADTAAEIATNKFSLNPMDILKGLADIFLGELKGNIWLIIQLIILGIITAVLTALQKGFGDGGITRIAFFACYALIVGLGVKVFIGATSEATSFIATSHEFVNKIIPIMLILLTTSGGIISGGLISPIILISTEIITYLITHIFMPLSFVALTLTIANNLSSELNITGLINLVKNVIKWGLGICLTLFVGILSVYSLFAPTLDSRTIALGEYGIKTFVPVVGNILADTVGLIATCSTVVKSGVGVAGLIGFALLAVFPIAKLLAQIGAMKLAGGILEPIVDSKISKCINDISANMTLILLMLMIVSIMFFVNIAVLVRIGGNSGLY